MNLSFAQGRLIVVVNVDYIQQWLENFVSLAATPGRKLIDSLPALLLRTSLSQRLCQRSHQTYMFARDVNSSVQVSDLKQRLALLHDKLTRIELQFEIYKKETQMILDQQLQKLWQELMEDSGSSDGGDD